MTALTFGQKERIVINIGSDQAFLERILQMAVPQDVQVAIAQWFYSRSLAADATVRDMYASAAKEARRGQFDDGSIKLIADAIDYASSSAERKKYIGWLDAIRG